jgi:hypothetical protein
MIGKVCNRDDDWNIEKEARNLHEWLNIERIA